MSSWMRAAIINEATHQGSGTKKVALCDGATRVCAETPGGGGGGSDGSTRVSLHPSRQLRLIMGDVSLWTRPPALYLCTAP